MERVRPGQVIVLTKEQAKRNWYEELTWEVLTGLFPLPEGYMAVGDVNSNEVGSGARFNDGKVRYDLIPTHLLESTANVLEMGAKKYAPWNWAKGMQFSVVIASLKRHMAALERGEDYDPESGQRHTGHLICNLLFLEHYMNRYPEMDDRPKDWFNYSNVGPVDPDLKTRVFEKHAATFRTLQEEDTNKKEENDERGYPTEQQSSISKQLSDKYNDSMVERWVPNIPTNVLTPLAYATGTVVVSDGGVAGHDCSCTDSSG